MANTIADTSASHFLLSFYSSLLIYFFKSFSQHACSYNWHAQLCLQAPCNWVHSVLSLSVVLQASALTFDAMDAIMCVYILNTHSPVGRQTLVCFQVSTITDLLISPATCTVADLT